MNIASPSNILVSKATSTINFLPINDLLNNLQNYLSEHWIVIALLSFLAGSILTPFFKGSIQEHFKERDRIKKHKLHVARHILQICNEASTGNYKQRPRDQEHVHSVMTNIEGINNEIGKTLQQFVCDWINCADELKQLTDLEKSERYVELSRSANIKRKKLIAWANKIRVGN